MSGRQGATKVRGRGQTGPRGLESDPTLERRLSGTNRVGVKQRLGGGVGTIGKKKRGGIVNSAALKGSIDLRRRLNEKTGKAAVIGDLRQLIGQEPSKRFVDDPPALNPNRRRKPQLMSPILAAAVSELGGVHSPLRAVHNRLGSSQVPRQTKSVIPGRTQLAAIRRTVDNMVPPTELKFTVTNPLAREPKFQDLTINKVFPKRRKPPVAMEVDEEDDDEDDDFDESASPSPSPPPPPPRPRPAAIKPKTKKQPVAAASPPAPAVPPRGKPSQKKGHMIMNRVRIAALPASVTTKEVTELCEDFGAIFRVNRLGKGAFEIDFEREEDARKAVLQCSQATLDGEPLQISLLPSLVPAAAAVSPPKSNPSLQSRLKPRASGTAGKSFQASKKKA